MDSLVTGLMESVGSPDNLAALGKAVGADGQAAGAAMGMSAPIVTGALSAASNTSGGADVMLKALAGMKGANPLDDLAGFLGNPGSAGTDLAKNLLGKQLGPMQSAIAGKTGLPSAVVGKLLSLAVPLVLAQVARMWHGQKLDVSGLGSFLGEQYKLGVQGSPEAARLAKELLGEAPKSGGIFARIKKLFGG